MTPLRATRPGEGLKRAIPRPIVGRDWVIELDSVELRVRQKRSRTVYSLPWDFVIQAAAGRYAQEHAKAKRGSGLR